MRGTATAEPMLNLLSNHVGKVITIEQIMRETHGKRGTVQSAMVRYVEAGYAEVINRGTAWLWKGVSKDAGIMLVELIKVLADGAMLVTDDEGRLFRMAELR